MKINIFEDLSINYVRATDLQSYLRILEDLKQGILQDGDCFFCEGKYDLVSFVEYSPRFDGFELKAIHDWFKVNFPTYFCSGYDLVCKLADSDKSKNLFKHKLKEEAVVEHAIWMRETRIKELQASIEALSLLLDSNRIELSQLESVS